MKAAKGQSSVEFLVSYGWVVVVTAGAILLLSQSGMFRTANCEKSIIGFSQVFPVDWSVYGDSNIFVFKVENWAGDEIKITGASVVLEPVTCNATLDVVLSSGNSSLLILNCLNGLSDNYQVGDCYTGDVDFTYINQRSGNFAKSKGKIRGSIELGYVTTTTSTTSTTSTTTTSTTSTTSTTTTTTSTTSTTTTTTTTTTMCALNSDCELCQKCSGGVCVNQTAGEDLKSECPGAFGTCAGASCNGAGACQYLAAGKQGCGMCQYCTGSSLTCVNVAADQDTYGDCTGNCDECNGAGACRGDNTRCSGTVGSCSCSGSGTAYNCQSCPDSYGACGDPTCSSYTCGNAAYAVGTDCGGLCQSCNGMGSCVNTTSGGDYQNECPGAFGTCAGLNCNGAGACQYLAVGKRGCGTCQYCTGSSYTCSFMAADSDTYGDCTGNCDECNGAGACRGDNTRCSGTPAACYCSGSGTSYTCQTCPDTYGACGEATCAAYACGNTVYVSGTDCGGTCQSCNGAGSCVNTASGSDYQNECPGSFGTCAGTACNGAAACQYLAAGKQGCGTCQYCTGSSFACANVASGSDPYNECSTVWNGCSSICVKSGLTGNCNGAAACATTTANVAVGNYCSAGTEVAGACNSARACTNAQNTDNAYNNGGTPYWTMGYCDGGGSCDRSGATGGDADDSSAACSCIKAASGYWNLGGEVASTTCCTDDAGENKRTRVCTSGCTSSPSDDACCNAATDCVYSSTCYSTGACSGTRICNSGSWVNHCANGVQDCGETGLDCGGSCPACPPVCYGTEGAFCYYSTTCTGSDKCCKKLYSSSGYCCTYGCCNINLGEPYCDGG